MRSEVQVRTGLKGQGASQGSRLCRTFLLEIEVLTRVCGQTTPVIKIANIAQIFPAQVHVATGFVGVSAGVVHLSTHVTTAEPLLINF